MARSNADSVGGDEVELGHIAGVFGVAGEVRLHLHNPDSDLFTRPRSVILVDAGGGRRRALVTARPGAGKRILGRIEGCTDRDAARDLMGTRVVLPADELPELEDDEFYLFQIEGADVVVDGQVVGAVRMLHQTAVAVILAIQLEGRRDEVLVPLDPQFVLDMDVDARRVVLSPEALEEA